MQQLECSDSKIITAAIVIVICDHITAGFHHIKIMISSARNPLHPQHSLGEHTGVFSITAFFVLFLTSFFFAIIYSFYLVGISLFKMLDFFGMPDFLFNFFFSCGHFSSKDRSLD